VILLRLPGLRNSSAILATLKFLIDIDTDIDIECRRVKNHLRAAMLKSHIFCLAYSGLVIHAIQTRTFCHRRLILRSDLKAASCFEV